MDDIVERIDALAKALCLLDSFAGEGLGHIYGNGTELSADDVVDELCTEFGIELKAGWWRVLSSALIVNKDEIRTLRTRLAGLEKVAEEMAGALEAMRHEETVSVHIGYDHGCGGGAYVYADAIRTDSDAFRSGERALTTYRNMKGQSDGNG